MTRTAHAMLIGSALLPAPADALRAESFYSGLPAPSARAAESVVQSVLERRRSGEREDWVGGDQEFGYVRPLRSWKSTSGHWCREFEERVYGADGRKRTRTAVACRDNGRWIVVTSR